MQHTFAAGAAYPTAVAIAGCMSALADIHIQTGLRSLQACRASLRRPISEQLFTVTSERASERARGGQVPVILRRGKKFMQSCL